jgi:hypothetical protein
MANIFANAGNLLLTAFFFHPLLPLSIPIAFVALTFLYWVNKYLLLWRVKRPDEMSGLIANFFANLLPWLALIWSISLALFYRTIFSDLMELPGKKREIPMWVMLGYSAIFALFPIRVCINRCLEKKIENIGGVSKYEELIHKFNSDYMRENPITEKEGQLKFFDKMIENETDEKKKGELQK